MSRFRWTEAEVARALGQPAPAGGEGRVFARVGTDSRSLGAGDLFVALAGERFDGHDFLRQAAAAGAAGAVVARVPEDAPAALRYFVVDDTLAALGALARHRRRQLRARVVAVAGSNGKTTTKDLLHAALGVRYDVHATEGNFNNQVGLPLTLLVTPDDAEVLVLEMGTDHPGEIAKLAAIAEPDVGVITVVAEEHLERLGSLEGVLREETSLLEALPPHGRGYVSDDPPALAERAREILGLGRVRVASLATEADYHPDGGRAGVQMHWDGTTRWSWRGIEVHLPLRGLHNVRNALLALAVAVEHDVEPEAAVRGIEQMPPPKLRGEWLSIGSLRLIADCYNANPASLAAAVDLLAALPAEGPKVAVIGTMRELGVHEDALHRRAADEIAARIGDGIHRVVATGRFVQAFQPYAERFGEALILCEDPIDAYARLTRTLAGNETILLKASRGEALERWIPLLERDWAGRAATDGASPAEGDR